MAFIVALVVFVLTVALAALTVFANGMSDAPGVNAGSPLKILVIGSLMSGAVVASHYVHISW